MFANPIPAPNPISLTLLEAVEKPAALPVQCCLCPAVIGYHNFNLILSDKRLYPALPRHGQQYSLRLHKLQPQSA